MVNRKVREELEKDPNRDMSHVPGSYNRAAGNALPMSRKGRSWEGRKPVKRRKENPRQNGTPARKK
jgi:hypothetical protein